METDNKSSGSNPKPDSTAGRFFWRLTAIPKTVVVASVVFFAVSASFIPRLTQDTSAEAFIGKDHPVVVYRDKVEEIFGLADPIVFAVVNDGPEGVFNPESLALVSWLTDELYKLEGIDPDRITSLATEKDITGTEYGMEIELFFEYPPETQEEADAVREKVMDFPLYLGSLVARDGSATLVVAELVDPEKDTHMYRACLELAARAPLGPGDEVHVAGEGAVNEFLGSYIANDAQRLNPFAGLIITVILLVAYRTWRGIILPNLVVVGTMGVALGSMAGFGVPFYVITNALPVVLIAICVADAIHILSQYYEELAHHPKDSQRQLVVRAMVAMWRPVTFTSLTDIAGFLALGFSSFMPPMRAFGVFASIGVTAALLFSLLSLPAALMFLKPKQSGPFKSLKVSKESVRSDGFSKFMDWIGARIIRHSTGVLVVAALIVVVGVFGASKLVVDDERMSVFRKYEPIHIADTMINAHLDGTSNLDIVIEAPEIEDLLRPEHLRRIEALQEHVESLPHVRGSTSIVDYLKQMNRAMNEDRMDAYVLPDSQELAAQYFLLYEVSADPTDFEEEIDYDYRMANVRAVMDTGRYSHLAPVVQEMERYIAEEFNSTDPKIEAHLAGQVNLTYHWIKDLSRSHFTGVALALIAVWLMSSLAFRSFVAGLLATAPVCIALLSIYAVMGIAGVWLGIGTTMFAAIAIGVSVDFSIHTLDRLIALVRDERRDLDEAFRLLYPSTGRALLFSGAAMVLGFGVLLLSEVPPLNEFGALVGVAVSVSFVASMTVLPALVKVLRPSFLNIPEPKAAPDAEPVVLK